MMGLDDFLIGIITNGIVAWLADADAKIEDAQRKRLKQLLARIAATMIVSRNDLGIQA